MLIAARVRGPRGSWRHAARAAGARGREDAVGIDAAIALRALCTRGESEAPGGVFALFDALVALLTGEGRRQ